MKIRSLFSLAAMTCLTAVTIVQNAPAAAPAAAPPAGRTPGGGLTGARLDELAQKHPEFLGALAPQILNKKRPKPPFDLTGTWFVEQTQTNTDFRFGPPYPE